MTIFSIKRCLCLLVWLFLGSAIAGLSARTMQMPEKDTIAPAADKPTDWDVAVEAVQLSKDAGFIRDSFANRSARLHTEREMIEETLRRAEADTTTDAARLKSLRTDLKTAQKVEKDAEKDFKRAKTTAEFAESVANMESRQQRQQLPKSRKQVQQLKNIFNPPPPEKEKPEKEQPPAEPVAAAPEMPVQADSSAVTPVQPTMDTPEKRRVKTKPAAEPKPVIRTYSAAEDVMINPPALPCSLAPDIRDEFSGEVRRETMPKEIFRYTNQALRKVYTADKPHTIAEASLISSGLNAALHLTFRIYDPTVRRTQGSLQKGGTATLKFMDGNSIILYNSRSDEGVTDPEGQFVVYQAQFPIDRATIKKLRSTELDRIRLAWTNGYEDYDVQQVDLLMGQAKCIFE